jgi:hypothetical protein
MTDPYRAMCAELVAIEDALSRGSVQFSNQGQAIDGYSALATFRYVADKARILLAQQEPEGPTDEEIMELMPQQMRDDLAARPSRLRPRQRQSRRSHAHHPQPPRRRPRPRRPR